MDTVTLSKQNRLYWLGRYSERAYTTLQYILGAFDSVLDGAQVDYSGFCLKMGIPCPYTDTEDFWQHYLFDISDPNSIRSCIDNMLGNGMVLRETITTPSLSYLQMAQDAIAMAETSASPHVELQWVLDDIMAFRGCFDDAVDEEDVRNILKAGGFVERLSLMLRLDWRMERLQRELLKLMNRLYKTNLPTSKDSLEVIQRAALAGEETDHQLLLRSVESLFLL
ncbi:MAG: alpha-E domain-containing protein [Oscillospiraceae bacterium]|nr:alpha-E domain-containing protein [Oscillospiraceae bacterium]